jgi:hypothetical protein
MLLRSVATADKQLRDDNVQHYSATTTRGLPIWTLDSASYTQSVNVIIRIHSSSRIHISLFL